ncbi:MAG: sugar phosphate nucleotidyltransferase [Alteripontixanthobacter sp.]
MDETSPPGLITPVILCGGSGTRLWPRSRKALPKPFLPLLGQRTLFQKALDRCADRGVFAAPLVVAGPDHVPHIEEQASDVTDLRIAVEPAARNTAPAIALAAGLLDRDAVMLVCPSDHHIADETAFVAAAKAAARLAGDDYLVALGITPGRPETGYGYIESGERLGGGFNVDNFVEKPDLETAERFLASGNYSWNGGIFAFRAGAFLSELAAHRPEMAEAIWQAVKHGHDKGHDDRRRFHPQEESFAAIQGESVDYAVMENTQRAAMVPAAMGWSDIGDWRALHGARAKDANGNSVHGPGADKAQLAGCRNVLVESDGPRVSASGLSDIVIVVDGDEVLVTAADGAQKVGKLRGASEQ